MKYMPLFYLLALPVLFLVALAFGRWQAYLPLVWLTWRLVKRLLPGRQPRT